MGKDNGGLRSFASSDNVAGGIGRSTPQVIGVVAWTAAAALLLCACGSASRKARADAATASDSAVVADAADAASVPCHHVGECACNGKTCGVGEVCIANDHWRLGVHLPAGCTKLDYELVQVPEGPFWMGCNAKLDDECKADELPQHEVQLDAYDIGKYEVSVRQFALCLDTGACTWPDEHEDCLSWCPRGTDQSGPDYPMTNLLDYYAAEFCSWALKDGRLPTEAEWEKAARGGCELYPGQTCKDVMPKYPWGAAPPSPELVYDGGHPDALPVQTLPDGASPYGLFHMADGVAEPVLDCGQRTYDVGPVQNPLGTSADGTCFRRDRGAYRAGARYGTSGPFGVRCARSSK